MFTAERVAILMLAIAIIVWACIVFIDEQSPAKTPPATTISIDSLTRTLPSDSVSGDSGIIKKHASQKKDKQKKRTSKKNKPRASEGPRDHLNEPIPQEE